MAAEPTDLDLRAVALSHVSGLAQRHGVLSWSQIAEGFQFRGERLLLANHRDGVCAAGAAPLGRRCRDQALMLPGW